MTERAMLKVALTGSIAMGKSTVAGMIRELGVPVFDADATVHELYAAGGKAVEPVGRLFPEAIVDGAIDRTRLSGLVVGKPDAMARLEQVVHPLVHAEQEEFCATRKNKGSHWLSSISRYCLKATGPMNSTPLLWCPPLQRSNVNVRWRDRA
jgi:dephospho-CoA kinase